MSKTIRTVTDRRVAVVSAGVTKLVRATDVRRIAVAAAGIRGPAGTGSQQFFDFAYGDPSPVTLVTVAAGKRILSCEIAILTPFDGVGASLQVGDAGQLDRLMAASDNLPSVSSVFSVSPNIGYGSATELLLSIVPGAGATAGSGMVVLTIQT